MFFKISSLQTQQRTFEGNFYWTCHEGSNFISQLLVKVQTLFEEYNMKCVLDNIGTLTFLPILW